MTEFKAYVIELVHWPYAESTAGFCLRVVAKTSTERIRWRKSTVRLMNFITEQILL